MLLIMRSNKRKICTANTLKTTMCGTGLNKHATLVVNIHFRLITLYNVND